MRPGGEASGQGVGARIQGLLNRARFTSIGAGILAAVGTYGLLRITGSWPLLTVGISALLILLAARLEGQARGLLRGAPAMPPRRGVYLSIVVLEYVGFAAGIAVCRVVGREDLIGVVIIGVSGLHFLALAILALANGTDARPMWVKGGLLLAIVASTVTLVPPRVWLGGKPVTAWLVFPCFAAAIVLWVDSALALASAKRLWQRSARLPQSRGAGDG